MKRTDLKTGDELYYAMPRTWDNDYSGEKAVVLAVEPHEASRWGHGESRFHTVAKGTGVLVELHKGAGVTIRSVVSLAHLRGPYDTIAAEVKDRAKQRRAHAAEQMAARKAVKANAESVAKRARDAGFGPYGVMGDGALISLAPDVLAALLDAAGVPQADADMVNARTIAETT